MEILSPNFVEMAWRVTLVFAALSAGVLLVIIGVHWESRRNTRRATNLRSKTEPLLAAYLAGKKEDTALVDALAADPVDARALLMDLCERSGRQERSALRELATALPDAGADYAAMRSHRWETRLAAAERLSYFGGPEASQALMAALGDEILAVRLQAARGLAALGDPGSAEPVLMAFDLPGDMNQRRVAEILFDYGEAAARPLVRIARNEAGLYSDSAVSTSARVLGMLRCRDAVAPLSALLGNSEYRVRLNAARALGEIGERSALPGLVALAADPVWEVRNAAVQAIGKMGSTAETELLTEALGDTSWWVRRSAARALLALGSKGVDALRQCMRHSPDHYASDASREALEELRIRESKEAA